MIKNTIKSIKQQYIRLGIIITLKAHCVFDHLLYLLDYHSGSLLAYAEDFIKARHQTGLQEENQSSGIKIKSKKANQQNKWEYERSILDVITKREQIKKQSKRKFKNKKETKGEKKQKEVQIIQTLLVEEELK